MINPETETGRLLRNTAILLNSVAEAAWANGIRSPAKWDLHRTGTEAYLAHRDILDVLDLPEVMAEPQAGLDIAAALGEAVQVVVRIPEECRTLVTQRLLGRVISLAEQAECVIALPHAIRLGQDVGPLRDHERLLGGPARQ